MTDPALIYGRKSSAIRVIYATWVKYGKIQLTTLFCDRNENRAPPLQENISVNAYLWRKTNTGVLSLCGELRGTPLPYIILRGVLSCAG